MKATAGSLPTDEGWAFEIKWDGMRVVASIAPGAERPVRLTSSTAKDADGRFPELLSIGDVTGGVDAVLDGEAVVLDDRGRSDFSGLVMRDPADRSRALRYVVFDVLRIGGRPTVDLPLRERHRLLEDLVEETPRCTISRVHDGDGAALLAAAEDQGLEGLVAKRWDSRYQVAKRSTSWRKIKIRRRQEFVVGGWTAGEGNRSDTFGALLIGYHDRGLRFAGRVGTGFDQRELDRLVALLTPLGRDDVPFVGVPPDIARSARYVDPKLVVEVEFAEWTPDGVLRHPAYAGRRDDVDPDAVVREPHPADR